MEDQHEKQLLHPTTTPGTSHAGNAQEIGHKSDPASKEAAGGAEDLWIPLMDYAIKMGISLSTLRRHIKANKIPYKVENGRYLLKDAEPPKELVQARNAAAKGIPVVSTPLEIEFNKISQDLKKAQEEIAELKTLIAFYEDN